MHVDPFNNTCLLSSNYVPTYFNNFKNANIFMTTSIFKEKHNLYILIFIRFAAFIFKADTIVILEN